MRVLLLVRRMLAESREEMNSSQGIGSPLDSATTPSEGSSQIPEGSTTRSRVSRRRVVTGIAWAAPVAAVTTPALAVQASMCGTDADVPYIGFGAVPTSGTARTWNTSTWTADQLDGAGEPMDPADYDSAWGWTNDWDQKTPGFRQDIQYTAAGTGLGPWFGVGTEARQAVTVRAQKDTPVQLRSDCQYTITANYATWEGDPSSPTLTMRLRHADGVTGDIPAFTLTTRTGRVPGWEREDTPVESDPFAVPSEGPWIPEVYITFDGTESGSSNDIYLRSITLHLA